MQHIARVTGDAGLCGTTRRESASQSPLEQFAATLSQGVRPLDEACEAAFTMYTLPLEAFMKLSVVKAHEELLRSGDLVEFERTHGHAVFVSHQWLADEHPDPAGQQLKVLQDALRNMLSGKSQIVVPPVVELFAGRVSAPAASELRAKPLFIWYDYFSCPQSCADRQASAIRSINSYVARSAYFMVLCPALKHQQHGGILSQATWGGRGWCRAERMSRELGHIDSSLIVVESATHQTLLPEFTSFLYSVGDGAFTHEEDRQRVSTIIVQMVWSKLLYYLSQGELHNYRFLLNQQSVRFAKLTADHIDMAIPGFTTEVDPFADPGRFLLDRFLHQNGFRGIFDRDKAGWSPLCFAAMDGRPLLITALLQQRADPNDRTSKGKLEALLPKHMPVLSIAACYKRNDAVSLLLAARAWPNSRDGRKATALHWASIADNAEGIRLLCQGGADLTMQAFPELVPLLAACAEGAVAALQEILLQVPNHSLQHGLHFAFIMRGGSPNLVSALIQGRADINEQFDIQWSKQPSWWILFRISQIRRTTRDSRLSLLAYHHSRATPLMLSILCGSFGAAYVLLAAGARVDLRNSRGKTAQDLAKEAWAWDLRKTSKV
ncbi:unnamed protein product [Symbiodinium sp. CCMP2592]|nr:unnamed protein product [Symbiodinium sp. CCMP2592]